MFSLKWFVLGLTCISTPMFAQEKLIFAMDMIRHGDRAPLKEFPNHPFTGPAELGQLTPLGMQQEYQLGLKFRQKYVTQQQLLPDTYDPDLIYIRSTDYNRTLMSAQSLLMGLYPLGTGPRIGGKAGKAALPELFQPIPIHTRPKGIDRMIPCMSDTDQFREYRNDILGNDKVWQQKTAQYKDKFASWSQISGLPIKSLSDAAKLGNMIEIYQRYDVKMPSGFTADDYQQIKDICEWIYLYVTQIPEIGSTLGAPMLTEIADLIKAASENKTQLKYMLLSGHDISILSLAGALNSPLHEFPGYSSALNLALYQDDNKHYVKFSFNDKPYNITYCGGNSCSIAQLQTLAEQATLKAAPQLQDVCVEKPGQID